MLMWISLIKLPPRLRAQPLHWLLPPADMDLACKERVDSDSETLSDTELGDRIRKQRSVTNG